VQPFSAQKKKKGLAGCWAFVHLDDDNCMEVTALQGSSGDVQHFADRFLAERGDRDGRVAMIPTSAKTQRPQGILVACLSRVVCHEHRPSTRRCATVREMKEGPSGSAIRCRSQAAASRCRQKRSW